MTQFQNGIICIQEKIKRFVRKKKMTKKCTYICGVHNT